MPEQIKELALRVEGGQQSVRDSDAQIADIIQSLKREIPGTTGTIVDIQATQISTPRIDVVTTAAQTNPKTVTSAVVPISFQENQGRWIGMKRAERKAKIARHQHKAA